MDIKKFFNISDKVVLKQAMPAYVIQSVMDPRIVAIRTRRAKEEGIKELKEEKDIPKQKPKIKKTFNY